MELFNDNGKKTKNYGLIDLKMHTNQSHNQSTLDAKLIALVKSLARRSAQEDFTAIENSRRPSTTIK